MTSSAQVIRALIYGLSWEQSPNEAVWTVKVDAISMEMLRSAFHRDREAELEEAVHRLIQAEGACTCCQSADKLYPVFDDDLRDHHSGCSIGAALKKDSWHECS